MRDRLYECSPRAHVIIVVVVGSFLSTEIWLLLNLQKLIQSVLTDIPRYSFIHQSAETSVKLYTKHYITNRQVVRLCITCPGTIYDTIHSITYIALSSSHIKPGKYIYMHSRSPNYVRPHYCQTSFSLLSFISVFKGFPSTVGHLSIASRTPASISVIATTLHRIWNIYICLYMSSFLLYTLQHISGVFSAGICHLSVYEFRLIWLREYRALILHLFSPSPSSLYLLCEQQQLLNFLSAKKCKARRMQSRLFHTLLSVR